MEFRSSSSDRVGVGNIALASSLVVGQFNSTIGANPDGCCQARSATISNLGGLGVSFSSC